MMTNVKVSERVQTLLRDVTRDENPGVGARPATLGVAVSEKEYLIEIRVLEIRGRGICPFDIKAGDVFHSDREIAATCHWAAHTLLPFTTTLRFGGDVPWEGEPGLARICCPDPDNSVVFEVRRVESDA